MKAQIQEQLKSVAENIRHQRVMMGYPQEYLAECLSITVKAYNKIENGHSRVSIINLFHIAEILNVPASLLVYVPEKRIAYPAINPSNPPKRDRDNLKLHQLL
jgi:transcriptional regulator with XRE-family HTH domain